MTVLTRAELARGRALLQAAFKEPWRYKQFEIECNACENGIGPECINPECTGAGGGVPATFVEAPQEYPPDDKRPQIVATIEVPGMSDLAQQNGEAICWLRNEGAALIASHELLLDLREAIEFIADREEHAPGAGPIVRDADGLLRYAKSLGWTGARP